MQVQVVQPTGVLQYVIPVVVIGVVLSLRVRSMSRVRPLKLERLWVVPAIYLAITIFNVFFRPPTLAFGWPPLLAWVVMIVALVIGAGIGWQRGRLMRIHIDPDTHALSQKGSPLAILLILAIVLVKMLAQGEGRALHFDVQLVTDAAFCFALGMFTTTRVEMYLRATRMLQEVRAA